MSSTIPSYPIQYEFTSLRRPSHSVNQATVEERRLSGSCVDCWRSIAHDDSMKFTLGSPAGAGYRWEASVVGQSGEGDVRILDTARDRVGTDAPDFVGNAPRLHFFHVGPMGTPHRLPEMFELRFSLMNGMSTVPVDVRTIHFTAR